jgi:hypothetical protein
MGRLQFLKMSLCLHAIYKLQPVFFFWQIIITTWWQMQCDSNYDLCEEKVPEVPAIRQNK